MELNEKLQELRKKKGLTQEELAAALYVSRTAVSKWESGRGYPSIDSLKAIAKFFAVSIDELLSSEQLLAVAEEDHKQLRHRLQDLLFGLLDSGAALYFSLPLFRQESAGAVEAVSLMFLTQAAPYLKGAYIVLAAVMVLLGLLTLTLQTAPSRFWLRHKRPLSLAFHSAALLLFIISLQPYAAVFSFLLLGVKALFLLKRK